VSTFGDDSRPEGVDARKEVAMQNPAPRLPAEQYSCNFADLHPPLTATQAAFEASRCLFCFEAPCITACPTHIDVPSFILKIRNQNTRGAARVILDANPLGASCARVCPVEALCEGACVVNHDQERPVAIGRLQRFATDWYFEHGMPPLFTPAATNGRRVALIGAGPASLGCAAELRKLGYAAILYERDPLPGGLNTYGIAQYKMTPRASLEEIEFVKSLGAELRTGVEVGRDVQVADLRRDHDAVFIGVGLGKTQGLGIPGEERDGVWEALDFIRQYKTKPYGEVPVGRRVAVIGAGNTSIDAATAAVRLGADEVTIVYRRGRDEMPAYDYEYELAKQDGVRFEWWTVPIEVLGDGPVTGLRCVRMRLSAPGAGGQRALEPVAGSEFTMPVDMVVKAVGQEKRLAWLESIPGLRLAKGVVAVDRDSGMTSVPGLFAGGDCANGGQEVVNAVAEGKLAAHGIDRWVRAGAKPR
jgi:glutamate synthase (NADPH/NADH) small chain